MSHLINYKLGKKHALTWSLSRLEEEKIIQGHSNVSRDCDCEIDTCFRGKAFQRCRSDFSKQTTR